MTNTHTQGPWTVGMTGIGAPMVQTGTTRICDVQKTDDFCETAIANARLIASAPTLLSALQELFAVGAFRNDLTPAQQEAIDAASQAIKQATNEV